MFGGDALRFLSAHRSSQPYELSLYCCDAASATATFVKDVTSVAAVSVQDASATDPPMSVLVPAEFSSVLSSVKLFPTAPPTDAPTDAGACGGAAWGRAA